MWLLDYIDSILKRLHLCVIMPTSSRRKKQLDKELHDAARRSKTGFFR